MNIGKITIEFHYRWKYYYDIILIIIVPEMMTYIEHNKSESANSILIGIINVDDITETDIESNAKIYNNKLGDCVSTQRIKAIFPNLPAWRSNKQLCNK